MSHTRPTTNRARLWQGAFALIVTVGLCALLFQMASPGDFHQALLEMPWGRLALGAAALSAMFAARVWKYNLALGDDRRPWAAMYSVLAVYSFLKNMVPFRVGELSLIYLFKRRFDIPAAQSTAVLYVGLASDMVSLLFLGLASLVGLHVRSPSLLAARLSIATGAMLAAGVVLYYFAAPVLTWTMRALAPRIANRGDGTAARRALDAFERFGSALVRYTTAELTVFLVLSGVTWVIRFAIIALILPAWDIRLGFIEVCAVTAMMSLLSSIPIQGLAGFGTMEAAWTLGFVALGVPTARAVTVSFATHVAIVLMMFAHFVAGWVISLAGRGGTGDHERREKKRYAKAENRPLVESLDGV
ncbi:MAG: flippase-like domain-containing protein [Deltaproteobacteria bacterium]|nr:flippase-like domain-containing protein [Deltaproteobacteria bacterium]